MLSFMLYNDALKRYLAKFRQYMSHVRLGKLGMVHVGVSVGACLHLLPTCLGEDPASTSLCDYRKHADDKSFRKD